MLTKSITYNDLDGKPVTEVFYFNLSKAEIAEMELSHNGGLSEYLKRIVEDKNGKEIIAAFKEILLKSIGRRSEDGKRFIKSDEIALEFMQTGAYSELFIELVTDAEQSAAFIRGIVPSSLSEKIDTGGTLVELPKELVPAKVPNPLILPKEPKEEYTHQELLEMPQEQFDAIAGVDARKMKHEHLVVAMQRKTRE